MPGEDGKQVRGQDRNSASRRPENGFLECGKIVNTRGLDGEVKLESWCDSPAVLASLEVIYFADGRELRGRRVLSAKVSRNHVFMKLSDIDGIDAAEAMRGAVAYAAKSDLPLDDGAFFIADLIGLPVVDADTGKEYGRLADVFNAGASDVYTVDTPSGQRMMPAVKEFVIRIDPGSGIYVRPIEGMFD